MPTAFLTVISLYFLPKCHAYGILKRGFWINGTLYFLLNKRLSLQGYEAIKHFTTFSQAQTVIARRHDEAICQTFAVVINQQADC